MLEATTSCEPAIPRNTDHPFSELIMIADYLFRQASEAKTSRAGSLSSKSCTLARSSSTVPSSAMTGPESQPISEEHAFVYMHCWYSLCKAHPLPRHRVPHFSCGFKKYWSAGGSPVALMRTAVSMQEVYVLTGSLVILTNHDFLLLQVPELACR